MVWPFSKSKSKNAKKTAKKKSPAGGAKKANAKPKPKNAVAVLEAGEKAPAEPREPAPATPRARRRTKHEMTPERERLIRQALLVHASQTKVLDELDDGLKERLRSLAEEKLLGGGETKH